MMGDDFYMQTVTSSKNSNYDERLDLASNWKLTLSENWKPVIRVKTSA